MNINILFFNRISIHIATIFPIIGVIEIKTRSHNVTFPYLIGLGNDIHIKILITFIYRVYKSYSYILLFNRNANNCKIHCGHS